MADDDWYCPRCKSGYLYYKDLARHLAGNTKCSHAFAASLSSPFSSPILGPHPPLERRLDLLSPETPDGSMVTVEPLLPSADENLDKHITHPGGPVDLMAMFEEKSCSQSTAFSSGVTAVAAGTSEFFHQCKLLMLLKESRAPVIFLGSTIYIPPSYAWNY